MPSGSCCPLVLICCFQPNLFHDISYTFYNKLSFDFFILIIYNCLTNSVQDMETGKCSGETSNFWPTLQTTACVAHDPSRDPLLSSLLNSRVPKDLHCDLQKEKLENKPLFHTRIYFRALHSGLCL